MGEVGCVRVLNFYPPPWGGMFASMTYGYRVRNLRYTVFNARYSRNLTSQLLGISGLVGAPICVALLGGRPVFSAA